MKEWVENSIVVNGHEQNYLRVGKGNPVSVALFHAFPFNWRMWCPQISQLALIADVVAYDIRGFGKSECGQGEVTIETYCDDFIQLMEKLKLEKTILCGLSMGGYIALRLKEKHPHLFSGLVLADTRTGVDSAEAKAKRFANIEKLQAGGTNDFAESFLKGALSEDSQRNNPELLLELKNCILNNKMEGMTKALKAMAGRTDTSAALTNHRLPTLILVGEKDKLTTPTHAAEMHALDPKSKMHVIAGAGHLSNLENPQMFNEKLLSFMKEIRG